MNGLFTILCMNRITGKPITLALFGYQYALKGFV